jgi:tetratricopeptide (TPR) repeat protein
MTDPAQVYAELLTAFNRSDWRQARALAQQLLPLASDHPLVQYVAGVASLELGQLPQATMHLGRAVALDPHRVDFATHYARALSATGARGDALRMAEQALALAVDPRALDALGNVFTQCGSYSLAAQAYASAIALAPDEPNHHFNFAAAQIAMGGLVEAERALENCLALDPHYWRAHFSLAQLRTQTPSSHHLARLQALLPQAGDDRAALTCLHLALAKEHEDLGEYADALDHLTRGKHAGRPARTYTRHRDEATFTALRNAFPEPLPADMAGHPSQAPIFIIGMPRSGTTLVDRILSSHPQVHSAGELHTFGQALGHAAHSANPFALDSATIERAHQLDWHQLGAAYIAGTREVAGERPRFIDKFPHNFLYAGFIARALPHARIVCLRRDPMDTCLSNFRQLFATEWPYFDYSYDLLDTGHYYVLFDALMTHWQQVLPGRVLQLDYETLLDAQEATTRELLAFCKLPWDEACLRFDHNPAPVTTPSAVQVRSPLHRKSLQRWKRYGNALDPLRALLQQAGIEIPS